MSRAHFILAVLTGLCISAAASASDVRVTFLPHTDRLVFGDPLYVQVTLTNHGGKPVAGPRPDLSFGSLAFTISDAYGHLAYRTIAGAGLQGGLEMLVFEPGKPVTYYFTLMLPRYRLYDDVFWKRYREGAIVTVQVVYRPIKGKILVAEPPKDVPVIETTPWLPIMSAPQVVHIEPRPNWQIQGMRFWAERKIDPDNYKKGPFPADFHLPVHVANREEMTSFEFATLLDGELGGLVSLSLMFRDIYELPPESREPANRDLVDWLKKEPEWKRAGEFYMIPGPGGGLERVRLRPEVKRKTLAHKVRATARNYNMRSTAKAMEEVIKEPALSGDKTVPQSDVD